MSQNENYIFFNKTYCELNPSDGMFPAVTHEFINYYVRYIDVCMSFEKWLVGCTRFSCAFR